MPTELAQLASLYPELVHARARLAEVTEATASTLTLVERRVAAFVTSTINGAACCSSLLARELADLDVPRGLVDTIRRAAGRWTVSDDDRIAVIVDYAVALTQNPEQIARSDIQRLRAVRLTDLDIVDLNNVVAYYNYVNRIANGLGLASEVPGTEPS
jgi:uncharacterized peroxidase-related enzyme